VTVESSFTWLRRGTVRVRVRADLAGTLGSWLLGPTLELSGGAVPLRGGRGGAYRVRRQGAPDLVVRRYRRGGAVGRIVTETYVGTYPRPFRELAITVEAAARGVPTTEVIAARVQGRFVYGGEIATIELPGARPLLEALAEHTDDATRLRLVEIAGHAVGTMHRAGVHHVDLNLGNILAHPPYRGHEASVIDLDRARLSPGMVPEASRRRSLQRLRRSLHKLDADGRMVGDELVTRFRRAYGEAAGTPCVC